MSNSEIDEYKKAVWDFILEHSDILPSGAVFVKFHTSGRRNFENRVWARYKYKYHREDVEIKGNTQEKLRVKFEKTKAEKKEKYKSRKIKKVSLITQAKNILYASIKTVSKRSGTTPEAQALNKRGG